MNLPLAVKAGTIGTALQFLLCLAAWIVNPALAPAAKEGGAPRALALLPVAVAAALFFFFRTVGQGLPVPELNPGRRRMARVAAWSSVLGTLASVFMWRLLPSSIALGALFLGFVLGPFLFALLRAKPSAPGPEPRYLTLASPTACGALCVQGTVILSWMATVSGGALFAAYKVSPTMLLHNLFLDIAPALVVAVASVSCGMVVMMIQATYAALDTEEETAAGKQSQ
jgi:hypothetical protein